jgi:effector-binding domain-containing protein
MKKLALSLFSTSLLFLLSCGGGGGGGSSNSSSLSAETRAVAVDDFIVNATVTVYDINNREQVYTTTTGQNGTITVSLPQTMSLDPLLLEVRGGCVYRTDSQSCYTFNGTLYTIIPPGWDTESNYFVVSPIQTLALLRALNLPTDTTESQILAELNNATDINSVIQSSYILALPEDEVSRLASVLPQILQQNNIIQINNNTITLVNTPNINVDEIAAQVFNTIPTARIQSASVLPGENPLNPIVEFTLTYNPSIQIQNYYDIIKFVDSNGNTKCFVLNASENTNCEVLTDSQYQIVEQTDNHITISVDFNQIYPSQELLSPNTTYRVIIDSNAPGVVPYVLTYQTPNTQIQPPPPPGQTSSNGTVPTPPQPGEETNTSATETQPTSTTATSSNGTVPTSPQPGEETNTSATETQPTSTTATSSNNQIFLPPTPGGS